MEKLKRIKEMYANSLKELFVTKNIVLCGLMAALAVVLSMTASVEVGPYIRIGNLNIPAFPRKYSPKNIRQECRSIQRTKD